MGCGGGSVGVMANVAHTTQLLFPGADLLCENIGWAGGWVGVGSGNDKRCTCYATAFSRLTGFSMDITKGATD